MIDDRADDWISGFLDRSATTDELAELDALISASPAAAARLIAVARLDTILESRFGDERRRDTVRELLDTFDESRPTLAPKMVPGLFSRGLQVLQGSTAASILLVAALFYGSFTVLAWNLRRGEVASSERTPQRTLVDAPPVAQLVATTDCRWKFSGFGGAPSPNEGTLFRTSERIELVAGVAEIQFHSGTKVLVEGPSTLNFRSQNSLFLDRGKLAASVPPAAVGFAVETPRATVVDLGTEFGVDVDESGETEVRVVRGTVVVEPSQAARRKGVAISPQRLIAGQSTRVDNRGIGEIVATSSAKRSAQIQTATSHTALDLVDIVAGGDGRYHRRNRGIDPTNGSIVFPPEGQEFGRFGGLAGHRFVSVADLPLIDGVSIIDPSQGPVQLTSAGHRFDSFSVTNGSCYGPVWGGGSIPEREGVPKFRSTFDGKLDYGVAPHGFIALIPNKLITFDLAAIRREYPNRTLATFRSVVGMTKSEGMTTDEPGLADIWVFVDGEVRHKRLAFNTTHGPQVVEVPLAKSARFLTLAATDGGNTYYYDWVMFGDPQIKFETNEGGPKSSLPSAIK